MTHERKRSKSPFPSAYKVLNEIENDREDTLKIVISQEFLIASRQKRGVWCQKCGRHDDTGLSWLIEIILDEEGQEMFVWSCDLCAPKEPPIPTDYKFSGTTLDNSIESVRLSPRPTKKPPRYK